MPLPRPTIAAAAPTHSHFFLRAGAATATAAGLEATGASGATGEGAGAEGATGEGAGAEGATVTFPDDNTVAGSATGATDRLDAKSLFSRSKSALRSAAGW